MTEEELKRRTKQFALRVMKLIIEGGLLKAALVGPLMNKAEELTAIMRSSHMTARRAPRSEIENRKPEIGNLPRA